MSALRTNVDKTLYNSCRDGNLREVKLLLTAGANVNSKFNYTPLTIASQRGHFEIVQLLLDNGANIEGTDVVGYSAIHNAAQFGGSAIVDLLAFRGANVELENLNGWTPLIAATCHNHVAAVETLVAFGADIDVANDFSNTALITAARLGRVNVVRLLLSLNADTTKTNRDGETAFQSATSDEIKQLFLDHEKKFDAERKQLAKDTLISIQHKVGVRLMRFEQDNIIGICLAFAPLELPPYVLLWIIDFLPNYNLLSHHKKIELITSVRDSIWKLKAKQSK